MQLHLQHRRPLTIWHHTDADVSHLESGERLAPPWNYMKKRVCPSRLIYDLSSRSLSRDTSDSTLAINKVPKHDLDFNLQYRTSIVVMAAFQQQSGSDLPVRYVEPSVPNTDWSLVLLLKTHMPLSPGPSIFPR
jgi:hypothetical protein